jgi:hypothetical protein
VRKNFVPLPLRISIVRALCIAADELGYSLKDTKHEFLVNIIENMQFSQFVWGEIMNVTALGDEEEEKRDMERKKKRKRRTSNAESDSEGEGLSSHCVASWVASASFPQV